MARNTAFTDATNSIYYHTDGVHLKTAANQKIAELVKSIQDGTYTLPVITTQYLPNATQNTTYDQTIEAINNTSLQHMLRIYHTKRCNNIVYVLHSI